jgi:hypothetical protein
LQQTGTILTSSEYAKEHEMRYALLLALAIAGSLVIAQTTERDILDAALERAGTTGSHEDLDAAARALRDGLPRPWTVPVVLKLYESATARWTGKMQVARDTRSTQMWPESDAELLIIEHLGTLLAASRDPRAVLVLGRQLEAPDTGLVRGGGWLADNLYRYVLNDPGYPQLPAPDRPMAFTNALPYMGEQSKRWWEMTRAEVERRAAAIPAPSMGMCTGCAPTDATASALIDRLVAAFLGNRPRLRVSFEGAATPRFTQFEGIMRPLSGNSGASHSMQRLSLDSQVIPLSLSGRMLGETGLSVRALVLSPGYRTVAIDVPDTAKQPEIPVRFIALPTRTIAGLVTFSDGATPRSFTLGVDMRIVGARGTSNVFSGALSTLQGIAEATVQADGAVTLVLPDVGVDPLLNTPELEVTFRLSARNAPFEIMPDALPILRDTDGLVRITASPRRAGRR